jgi:predicted phosphate transport protein (TIGR00153 family)
MQLFKKTKLLESKMDEFIDITSESSMIFFEGIQRFNNKESEMFDQSLKKIRELEHRADNLRRDIEAQLYLETLIPESRGDVLALLETTDFVINTIKETMVGLSIEDPHMPDQFEQAFIALAEVVSATVEEMAQAHRSFFRNPETVRDYLNKIHHLESESDQAAENLNRLIFRSDLSLSEKQQLRYFAKRIDRIADRAEDVADRLAIYTIKRSI